MKRKFFKTEEGSLWYDHYTGTDFFDVKLFPRRDGKQWKDIIGTGGQNAERKAKSRATSIFNYMIRLVVDDLIEKHSYIPLGIFGMGYMHKSVRDSDYLMPETLNKKAVICIVLSDKFKHLMKRWHRVRLTKPGRIKLKNSIKVKKYHGTIS